MAKAKIKAELLDQLIARYRAFKKWVLKCDPEILRSQRGKDHLKEIDELESQLEQIEAEGDAESKYPQSNRDFTMTDKIEAEGEKEMDIWTKEKPKEEGIYLRHNTAFQNEMTKQTVFMYDGVLCTNHPRNEDAKIVPISKMPDFLWLKIPDFNAKQSQPMPSVTDEEIKKEFPTDRSIILKNELSRDLFTVQRNNTFKQIGAKWLRSRIQEQNS